VADGFSIQNIPSTITGVTFSVTKEIIGEDSFDNVATFTFTPVSGLSTLGGWIDIETPNWYDYERIIDWPYGQNNLECVSTSFVTIEFQGINPSTVRVGGETIYLNAYRINYSALYG